MKRGSSVAEDIAINKTVYRQICSQAQIFTPTSPHNRASFV